MLDITTKYLFLPLTELPKTGCTSKVHKQRKANFAIKENFSFQGLLKKCPHAEVQIPTSKTDPF